MKTKAIKSPLISFMDTAAGVSLATLTGKAVTSFAAVIICVLARLAKACINAFTWCRYHFATLPRIYCLQLRVCYAVAGWMERHEKATNFGLVLMGVALMLEMFFLAPID